MTQDEIKYIKNVFKSYGIPMDLCSTSGRSEVVFHGEDKKKNLTYRFSMTRNGNRESIHTSVNSGEERRSDSTTHSAYGSSISLHDIDNSIRYLVDSIHKSASEVNYETIHEIALEVNGVVIPDFHPCGEGKSFYGIRTRHGNGILIEVDIDNRPVRVIADFERLDKAISSRISTPCDVKNEFEMRREIISLTSIENSFYSIASDVGGIASAFNMKEIK